MKNVMVKLAAFMFVAVALTTCTVSGTYAKYVSSSTGTDSARVAKWSITVGDKDIFKENTFVIDLFKDTYSNVAGANGAKVVAPGTFGEFDLVIENTSEVLAEYTIDYTVTNAGGVPIKFSVDGENWTTDLADITDAKQVAIGDSESIKVQWKWESVSDESDTALGVAGTAQVVVSAAITASQVTAA